MTKVLLKNKRASYEYELLKKYEAGVVLLGAEVKSLRHSSGSFHGAYIQIMNDEQAFLINAQISPYKFADNAEYDPKRTRKLLLHKTEIQELADTSRQKGVSIIPLAFILKKNHIKLELALAKGKKHQDRRRELKRKAQDRDTRREMKHRH